jgi:hypothetical protein
MREQALSAVIDDFRTRSEFLQTMTLVYAALAGFETPLSWRLEWGL